MNYSNLAYATSQGTIPMQKPSPLETLCDCVSSLKEQVGLYVTRVMENYGIGIPHGWEEKVFDLFACTEKARKIHPEGSGIGLYITKQIIQKHNGRIYIKNNHNPTIFVINLPKN